MAKLSELRTAREVRAEDLQDPQVPDEYERTALARAAAMRVLLRFRLDDGPSQSALGRLLGMAQPAVARLEAGDGGPSLLMLTRLSKGVGLEFHIDITHDSFALRESA